MQFFSISDQGRIRENNEDCALAKEIAPYTLLALADGMGGHKAGEIASKLAIEEVSLLLAEGLREKMLPGQIMLLLSETMDKVNTKIFTHSQSDSALVGMGTTCDVCLIFKNTAYISHVGDSRVYKVSASGNIKKLTKDHSLIERMLDNGTITPQEAINHPQKNVILKAIGISSSVEPDIFHSKISPGDVLLLCSDGLTNMVDDGTIARTVSEGASPEEIAKKLVQLANDAGGTDNITVIIAKC